MGIIIQTGIGKETIILLLPGANIIEYIRFFNSRAIRKLSGLTLIKVIVTHIPVEITAPLIIFAVKRTIMKLDFI